MVFPSKEKASAAADRTLAGAYLASPASDSNRAHRADWAAHWSKILNCQVRYSIPGEVFMVLEKDEIFLHVLFGKKQGWIVYKDWLKIVGAQEKYVF